MATAPLANLTAEDIEKMRQIVNQHDQMQQSFDINKPPQKQYRYQEYPRLVYKHDTRETLKVHSDEQLEEAKAAGYVIEPFEAEIDLEPELDAESAAELAKVEKALRAARAKAKKKSA